MHRTVCIHEMMHQLNQVHLCAWMSVWTRTRQADGHLSFMGRWGGLETRSNQPGIDGAGRTGIELGAFIC